MYKWASGGGRSVSITLEQVLVLVRQYQLKKCIPCLNYFSICVTRGGEGGGGVWGGSVCRHNGKRRYVKDTSPLPCTSHTPVH